MSGDDIEQFIFDVTSSLLIPVLVLALLALAAVLVETGRVAVELFVRRKRGLARLKVGAVEARDRLAANEMISAQNRVRRVLSGSRMTRAGYELLAAVGADDAAAETSKILADFDYDSVRALERTRILVRAGPALGLMGTLIPLSPALSALAGGDVAKLSEDLRVAFSVTVLGLFVGAVAFALSLVRDRLYAQDLSDLEYLTAVLAGINQSQPTGVSPAVEGST